MFGFPIQYHFQCTRHYHGYWKKDNTNREARAILKVIVMLMY